MSAEWRNLREAGSAEGIGLLVWVARVLGRRSLHAILVPIALYFMIVRHAERRASADYLNRVLGHAPTALEQFRHFYTFARVIADRYYFVSGQADKLPITVHGVAQLQRLVDEGRGGVAVSAHLGSFEAARVLASQLSNVVLRMVLDRTVSQNLVAGLESIDGDFAEAIIDLNQAPTALALTITEALQQGEWIGFLADRSPNDSRTMTIDFLGTPAKFPLGPYIIAGILKVPLVCVFPLFVNGGYAVHCEIISPALNMPREQRDTKLAEYATQFAALLETYVRKAPYNWFNFYDFWK